MRKKVIFASDTSEALDIVAREMGPSALILESKRVAGGVEIIAAPADDSVTGARRAALDRVIDQIRDDSAGPSLRPAMSRAAEGDRIQSILEKLDHIAAALKAAPPAVPDTDGTQGATATYPEGDELFRELEDTPPAEQLNSADLVLVSGASGSGKSSTLARIVACMKRDSPGARIMLVTTDANKPGAQRHLELLGRLLAVDALPAGAPVETLAGLAGHGYKVCVDMPSDLRKSIETAGVLQRASTNPGRVAAWLAMDASTGPTACAQLLDAARDVTRRVVITKTDEFTPTRDLLRTIARQGARVAAYCDGGGVLAPPRTFDRPVFDSWMAGNP